ncbi:MAG: hypothetical protein J5956_06210 [Ruminococcus sp.]|nr:hypothetical protein [Ruminococcus sp.]
MDIQGLWIISEVNAIGMDFEQTWRTVADLEADANVPPMQKTMAQGVYLFEDDGTFKQLMPKAIVGDDGEPYDDKFVIGHVGKWKEEDGKIFTEGDDGWQEAVPTDNGFEVFGFFRIVKA